GPVPPGVIELFRGPVLRTTLLTLLVCSLALTAHWAFLFWNTQQLRNLPDLVSWTEGQRSEFVSKVTFLIMVSSVVGNFFAALLARWLGYRWAIAALCLGYSLSMAAAYGVARDHEALVYFLMPIGVCQGVFALFTMYMPPLFPTLLRTTGAGFCYN